MKDPIKTGLAGFGNAAKVMHVPFLITHEGYRVTTVLERNGDTAADAMPGIRIVRTIEDLVADPEVELVIITTPNDSHFPYAEKAILAGKHVLLEKPFTITTNEASILIALAERKQVLLSVYQNRRYVSDFLTIQQLLRQGTLGKVWEFEAHFDRYRPEPKAGAWREANKAGSGILYDLGSHLIDQALVLFGTPNAIRAEVNIQRPWAVVDDQFHIDLYYDGLKVILRSSMMVPGPGPRYVLHGSKGSFIKYGEEPQEALLKQGVLPVAADWGTEPSTIWGTLHTVTEHGIESEVYPSLRGSFGFFYDDLHRAIREGAPLQVRPQQAYNTIRLIELALMSNKKKATIPCSGFMA